MPAQIVWFRRDLRLSDHPALDAALDAGGPVIPVFCFDRRILGGRHRSGPRTQFMLECLCDLDRALRARGSRLVVRHGHPESELPRLARQLGASAVHASADVSPFARARDARVGDALHRADAGLELHPGLFAVEDPAAVRTSSGDHYRMFTPYHRAWTQAARRAPLEPPSRLPGLPDAVDPGEIPSLADLGLRQEVDDPAPGGEHSGQERVDRFLAGDVDAYGEERHLLSGAGSALSPYLHFGAVSARALEARLTRGAGAAAFRRQLCWRDFYAQLLGGFPENARAEHQQRYRGTIRWAEDEKLFQAWCGGMTGYPLVDASMRQLRREGWMHNRGRLLVGSFLTKDLGIDWRRGESWFMGLLLDGDEASNNGNWQWIASVGVDRQPVARRIYNPVRQQAQFDPDGTFVRRYVPELARVPDRYLGSPWMMPAEVQEEASCVVGRDYPAPVVEHADARRAAIERYDRALR